MHTFPIGSINLYYFTLFSVTLTVAGVTRSAEKETCWLQFLTHFSTDQDEIWCGVEALYVKHCAAAFKWDQWNQEKELLFCWLSQECLSLAFELIWIKLGMIIDAVELYILKLVFVTWPWIKVIGVRESKTIYANNLTYFSSALDGSGMLFRLVSLMDLILSCCWVFFPLIQMREPYLCGFIKENLIFRHFQTDIFQT